MRTLKFRAWNIEKKSMLYFPLSNTGDTFQICFDGSNYRTLDHIQGISGPVDIMQFTGLRDQSEKEIYEGDIVQHTNSRIGEVKYCDNIQAFDMDICKYVSDQEAGIYGDRVKIIGNIYENPDLLK